MKSNYLKFKSLLLVKLFFIFNVNLLPNLHAQIDNGWDDNMGRGGSYYSAERNHGDLIAHAIRTQFKITLETNYEKAYLSALDEVTSEYREYRQLQNHSANVAISNESLNAIVGQKISDFKNYIGKGTITSTFRIISKYGRGAKDAFAVYPDKVMEISKLRVYIAAVKFLKFTPKKLYDLSLLVPQLNGDYGKIYEFCTKTSIPNEVEMSYWGYFTWDQYDRPNFKTTSTSWSYSFHWNDNDSVFIRPGKTFMEEYAEYFFKLWPSNHH